MRSFLIALGPATIIGAIVLVPDWRVWHRGVQIQGVVHYTLPHEHRAVFYGYTFNGGTYQYSSQGGAGFGNPPFDSLRAGTPLTLWVDPANPGEALPGQPLPSLKNNAIFVSLVLVALSVFFYRGFDRLPAFLRGES